MIFSKGEFVKVISKESPFYEKFGRIKKVSSLETTYPFIVEFIIDNKRETGYFDHTELVLCDGFNFEQDKQHYYFQTKMLSMSKKI